MFFELRQYRTKPGQRENWVKFMEEEIIPFPNLAGDGRCGKFRWAGRRRFVRLDSSL